MGNTATKETIEEKEPYKYQYKTLNGGEVKIEHKINPYEVLGVPETATQAEIKKSFKEKTTSFIRQDCAISSLAYYMLTSQSKWCFAQKGNQYIITNEDIFLLAAIGYTKRILTMISQDKALIHAQNEHEHTILYLAARSGFYDLVKKLLEEGSTIDHQQQHGSTALHAACYFGQREIVKLLLEYGANSTIKNMWDHTPEKEAANDKIELIFTEYSKDTISRMERSLSKHGIYNRRRDVLYGTENDILAMEIIVNEDIPNNWEMVWHGTRYKHVLSIMQYGLRPSGSTLPNGESIETREGHFKLGKEYCHIHDWARALFVSPSFRYAAHVAYAERIFSERIRYCVLIKAYVNPALEHKGYKRTTTSHSFLSGEPTAPEYRIEGDANDFIVRIQQSTEAEEWNKSMIIVRSVIFVKVRFLENVERWQPKINYEDIEVLFS